MEESRGIIKKKMDPDRAILSYFKKCPAGLYNLSSKFSCGEIKEEPTKLTWLARSMSFHPMFLKTSMTISAGRLSITMSIVAKCLSSKYIRVPRSEIQQCRSINKPKARVRVNYAIKPSSGQSPDSLVSTCLRLQHAALRAECVLQISYLVRGGLSLPSVQRALE